jgi:thiamine biosynthesis lipoprotein
VGGDVRVHGVPPDERGWAIPLAHPLAPDRVWGTVNLREGAIVTSTALLRRWVHDGRVVHHIIDPRTGHPAASGVVSVVCTASEAWFAEGVAKAALVAGPSAGRWLLDTSGVGGVLACDDGTIVAGAWWPGVHAAAATVTGRA